MAASASTSSSSAASSRPPAELLAARASGIFIDNAFRPSASGRTFTTSDPGTEEVLCDCVALGGEEDVDAAVQSALSAMGMGSSSSSSSSTTTMNDARARGALLAKLADLVERDADILAAIEAADSGKPLLMAKLADVNSAISVLRWHAALCATGGSGPLAGSQLPLGSGTGVGLCYTKKSPVGVVGAVLPFNFPLCGAVAKLAPAVAAGCAVVLKPSDRCPLSPLYLCSLVAEAGFPPGVVSAVPGGPEAGAALVKHASVAKVSFTGSTAVGKEIVRVAGGERLARITLELGGKNSCIVCPGADLEAAARIAAGGNFFNSGQICVGISRVLVPDADYDSFVEKVAERAKTRVLGDQFAEGAEQGPLVDARQLERVLAYVERGVAAGARLVCGGKRHGEKGFFMQPTVLADVDDDNVVAQEEIFGPVMCVQRYSGDVAEAVRRANNTPYGLAAVVVAREVDVALSVAHQLEAGTVWVNTHGVFDPVAPYQGHKQSGLGQEYGVEGVAAYLESKTVMVGF